MRAVASHAGTNGSVLPRTRVLYVIDSLAPGGAERSLATLAGPLRDRGVDLHIVALYARDGLAPRLRTEGIDVTELGATSPWRAVGALRTAIRATRPALVHTTLFDADLAGRTAAALERTPVTSTLANEAYGRHQVPTVPAGAAKMRAAQVLDALTARAVRRLHAVSDHVASSMAVRLRVARDRIEVIPRGRALRFIADRSAARANARRTLGFDADAPIVLAVARHRRQKGLDVLAEAAPMLTRSHPGVRILVAGAHGPETERIARSPHLEVLGHRDDIEDLLDAADAFVFPSRWEGLPGAVLEAMNAATPIVASDIPTVREAVGEHALLVPAGDPRALAEAIARTLTDPTAGSERASAARRRFQDRFTIDVVADGMADFFRRAAEVAR